MHALLAEHLPDRDFELDCSEFPCLAVIEDSATNGVSLEALKKEHFQGAEFVDQRTLGPGLEGASRHQYYFVALPRELASEETRERIDARIDDILRDQSREADESMGRPDPFGGPPGSFGAGRP